MARFDLLPHPDSDPGKICSLTAIIEQRSTDRVSLRFWIEGEIESVKWPARGPVEFADELWRHTCFETFFGMAEGRYREMNFASSLQWAAYDFEGYRSGMKRAEGIAPQVEFWRSHDVAELSAELSLREARELARFGLSAVIEAKDGTKSYWALAHAPGPPDFHNPDCFIATLPAPSAS